MRARLVSRYRLSVAYAATSGLLVLAQAAARGWHL